MSHDDLFPVSCSHVRGMTDELFGEVISRYTREQAIDDGVLVSGNEGDLREISEQHFKYPVAMTAAVFAIIQRAVESERHCNDYRGVWHDVLYMSKKCGVSLDATTRLFNVRITGAGRRSVYTFKIVCGPGDAGEPVLTVMLREED